MTNYSQGRAFEYAVRDVLTDQGFYVMRSAGSKTKVDLVAIKGGQIALVQCKRHGVISPAERTVLFDLAALNPNTLPLVASKEGSNVTLSVLTGTGPKDKELWIGEMK